VRRLGLRSALYRTARMMGDFNALRRGPRAVVKRVERKLLWRIAGRFINKIVGR
jgi:hypothetical protein